MCIRDRLKVTATPHEGAVLSAFVSTELRMYGASGEDGRISLFHIFNGEHFRTIYHPQRRPISSMALVCSPLAAVIFFCPEERVLYSYSINGYLLARVEESHAQVLSPQVTRSAQFMDLLVYGNEKGEVLIREAPFLELHKRGNFSQTHPVLSVMLSKDRRFLLCGCGDGEIYIMCDPRAAASNVRSLDRGLEGLVGPRM
eukprot:TRINITY_DN5214_c0_g1_i12.p1 TRINITY_DN5214_c0_g1~~TRINITY_DN5214_c0_g1_i12.p1  ORF type:complete len:200 (+),score=35.76 TRINITY_DN5214_c0_g1_i12:65-664(+)